MKCPHCNKEIKNVKERGVFERIIFPNLVLVGFVGGLGITMLLPFDVEHGYAINWDTIITLGFMVVYFSYLVAYGYGKVKGTFVWMGKEEEN